MENREILLIILGAVVLLFLFGGAGYGMMGYGYSGMMGYYGGLGLFWIICLLVIIALILFILWIIGQLTTQHSPERRRK